MFSGKETMVRMKGPLKQTVKQHTKNIMVSSIARCIPYPSIYLNNNNNTTNRNSAKNTST